MSEIFTDFIKIKTGLILKTSDTILMNENGVPTHSPEFNSRVYNREEEFRSKIITLVSG